MCGDIFGCVETFARIVFSQPGFEIGRVATIKLCGMSDALENIAIKHGFSCSQGTHGWKAPKGLPFLVKTANGQPSVARNRVRRRPSFAEASEGTILRAEPLMRFRAEDGGGGGS